MTITHTAGERIPYAGLALSLAENGRVYVARCNDRPAIVAPCEIPKGATITIDPSTGRVIYVEAKP